MISIYLAVRDGMILDLNTHTHTLSLSLSLSLSLGRQVLTCILEPLVKSQETKEERQYGVGFQHTDLSQAGQVHILAPLLTK